MVADLRKFRISKKRKTYIRMYIMFYGNTFEEVRKLDETQKEFIKEMEISI